MSHSVSVPTTASAGLGSSIIQRRPVVADADFDVTAMVDLVFMMNIFFLVTWVVSGMDEIDLPAANHVVASDPENCVIITMVPGAQTHADVFLGEEKRKVDEYQVEENVLKAVEDGVSAGKKIVLVKAARNVQIRDINSIATLVSSIEGINLRLAVLEKE